jgi:hypothetical protein
LLWVQQLSTACLRLLSIYPYVLGRCWRPIYPTISCDTVLRCVRPGTKCHKMGMQIPVKSILHDLILLPAMEQIVHVRILPFLEKVAHMPGGRLTREVLRSHAKPVGALKRGPKAMSTRKSYVRTLRAARLLDATSTDGAYDTCSIDLDSVISDFIMTSNSDTTA